jgi:hypothetical protein
MALKFLVRLCPLCIKKYMVMLGTNDGGYIFRRQHYHGAQHIIQLSTDHTLTVSRIYCLKKQFKDINSKKHGARYVHSYSINGVTLSLPHKTVQAMVNGVEQLNLSC